jgi:hypothetical protein
MYKFALLSLYLQQCSLKHARHVKDVIPTMILSSVSRVRTSYPLNWLRSVLRPKDGHRNVCQIIFKATYSQKPKSYTKLQLHKPNSNKKLVCPWRTICIIISGTDFVIHGSYLHLTISGTCFYDFHKHVLLPWLHTYNRHGPNNFLIEKRLGDEIERTWIHISNSKLKNFSRILSTKNISVCHLNETRRDEQIDACVRGHAHYGTKSAFRFITFMERKLYA